MALRLGGAAAIGRWLVLGCVALVGWASPMVAQAQSPEDAAKERARARFMEGREHFAAGRLAPALAAFEEANTIKPTPLMLSNIAQVYESMEDLPRAIESLKAFVATGKADAEAQARLAKLEADLATWPSITLSTVPPGAAVRLTSADYPPRCATTPCAVQLPPGMRTLRFDLAGHQTVERAVRFAKGQNLTFPPVVLPAQLGTVTIRSTPPGARVTVDAGVPGVTPFTQTLPLGEHVAVAQLDGHVPAQQPFTVTATHTAAAPLVVDLTLEVGVVLGKLEVTVDRVGAEIRVDGQIMGRSPLAGALPLSPGIHKLEVVAEDAAPYEEVVTIEANQTRHTRIELLSSGGGFALTQRTVSYGLMGLGAATLAGAGVMGALAMGTSGDLDACREDAACRRTDREVGLADDVRSGALTTDILLGAGVAIAATGVVLFLLDRPASPDPQGAVEAGPSVSVVPTAGGAAAVGLVRF